MKDILLLHDNAQPLTTLRTREAIAKMRCTSTHYSANCPDLALSDYYLFRPARYSLHGHNFAGGNELKKYYVLCSEVEAENFTTLT
jgi:hypothetical protein